MKLGSGEEAVGADEGEGGPWRSSVVIRASGLVGHGGREAGRSGERETRES